VGVIGGFTPPSVTVWGGTAGTYSPSNNSNCPSPQNPSPPVQASAIESYIQSQEGPDAVVEAMTRFEGGLSNETSYAPPYKNTTTGILEPSPGSGATVWGVDGSHNTVEGLENNAAPGTLPALQAIFAPGSPLYNLFGHMNTSSLCRRNNDFRIIYPTPGWSALYAIQADTNFGENPLTAVPSLGVSAAQGALDIFEAGYNQDIGSNFLPQVANTYFPFSTLPTLAQEAIADYAWYHDGGYLTKTDLGYYENGDFAQLMAAMYTYGGPQGAKDAAKLAGLMKNGQLPTDLNGKALC